MTRSPAHNSTTVDWSPWLTLTHAEREALRAKYRAIIKAESDAALADNYRAMNAAMANAGRAG
jgi:hypothetical protein